jgi:hypothetical protein
MNGPEDSPLVSSYINHKDEKRWQCQDCMDGSNCFTCEFCGSGLASEQVDYVPSGLREWWCIGCTEDEERLFKSSTNKNEWVFKND